ncbi:MAG: IS200/IS605 family transposase [Thermodesulfobacteriota bacterium]
MPSNKLTHTAWECKYHVVWVPKFRRKVVYGKLKREIGYILRKLCEYKGVEIIEARACRDHIHMCLSIPPKYAVANVIGYLKGKSTMIIFEKFSKLRSNFKGNSFWARGYYVNTVGLDEAKVREYIKNQEVDDMANDKYIPPDPRNLF